MMLYYKFYADSKGMMNIEKFMQFCRDFGVFPHLVSKGKLCTFFHALAGVRSQAEEGESVMNQQINQNSTMLSGTKSVSKVSTKSKKAVEQQEEDMIDQHMFVEVLAVIAIEIPYLNPQPNEIEKVKILNFEDGVLIFFSRFSIYSKN